MKRAFSTVMCMEADAEQVIALCRRHALDGAEIRLGDADEVLGLTGQAALEELREAFRQNGIQSVMLGSSVCLKRYDAEVVRRACHAICLAEWVGAMGIRVFLGNFAARNDAPKEPLDEDGICRALREIGAFGQAHGVIVCMETHNEFATGKSLAALLARVSCPNVKVIWDIIHPIEDGERIEETWEAIGEQIVHVHIKDGFPRPDAVWHDYAYTPLEQGCLPLRSALRLLEQNGYDGYVSMEWEMAWRPELQALGYANDRVLEEFCAFLDGGGDNLLPDFSAQGWEAETAGMAAERQPFWVSAHGEAAQITADADGNALHRFLYTARQLSGAAYAFSVCYDASGVHNPQSAFAILSVLDGDGNPLVREYADHLCDGRLEKKLRIPQNGCAIRVELGLKEEGQVRWYLPSLTPCAPPDKRMARIATTYVTPDGTHTIAQNMEMLDGLIDKAAAHKPDLILLSETIYDRSAVVKNRDEIYQTDDGEICTHVSRKAKQHGCYIAFTFHEADGNRRYNTAVLMDRQGRIAGKFRKTHITIVEYENGMRAGREYPVFDTDFGRIGMLVCWDAYFPEPARIMACKGAELLLISTAGDPAYRQMSRALENGVYVAVAGVNHVDAPGLLPSKIINPRGEVLAQTMEHLGVAVAEIDFNAPNYIYWLSVGAADGDPRNVYAHERQTDGYAAIAAEMDGTAGGR